MIASRVLRAMTLVVCAPLGRKSVSNRTIGTPILALYVLAWWGALFALFVFVTQNTAPLEPQVEWKDEVMTTTSKLAFDIVEDAPDPDGDEVVYIYQWYRDGELLPDAAGTSISSKETLSGQEWKVVITPDDGTFEGAGCGMPWRECVHVGDHAVTLTTTIANTPPRPRVRFMDAPEPEEELAEDEEGPQELEEAPYREPVYLKLSCYDPDVTDRERLARAEAQEAGEEFEKSEEDPCSYDIRWFKVEFDENGEEIEPEPEVDPEAEEAADGEEGDEEPAPYEGMESEYTEPMLPGRTASPDDLWDVVVIANDGEDDSEEPIVERIRFVR